MEAANIKTAAVLPVSTAWYDAVVASAQEAPSFQMRDITRSSARAQGLGDEDRQTPRNEEGDRGAGAPVGGDHAPHLG